MERGMYPLSHTVRNALVVACVSNNRAIIITHTIHTHTSIDRIMAIALFHHQLITTAIQQMFSQQVGTEYLHLSFLATLAAIFTGRLA